MFRSCDTTDKCLLGSNVKTPVPENSHKGTESDTCGSPQRWAPRGEGPGPTMSRSGFSSLGRTGRGGSQDEGPWGCPKAGAAPRLPSVPLPINLLTYLALKHLLSTPSSSHHFPHPAGRLPFLQTRSLLVLRVAGRVPKPLLPFPISNPQDYPPS